MIKMFNFSYESNKLKNTLNTKCRIVSFYRILFVESYFKLFNIFNYIVNKQKTQFTTIYHRTSQIII